MRVWRNQRKRLLSLLMVLMASNTLSDKPPIRIPGKGKRGGGKVPPFCKKHGTTRLQPIPNDSRGAYYCEHCPGKAYDSSGNEI